MFVRRPDGTLGVSTRAKLLGNPEKSPSTTPATTEASPARGGNRDQKAWDDAVRQFVPNDTTETRILNCDREIRSRIYGPDPGLQSPSTKSVDALVDEPPACPNGKGLHCSRRDRQDVAAEGTPEKRHKGTGFPYSEILAGGTAGRGQTRRSEAARSVSPPLTEEQLISHEIRKDVQLWTHRALERYGSILDTMRRKKRCRFCGCDFTDLENYMWRCRTHDPPSSAIDISNGTVPCCGVALYSELTTGHPRQYVGGCRPCDHMAHGDSFLDHKHLPWILVELGLIEVEPMAIVEKTVVRDDPLVGLIEVSRIGLPRTPYGPLRDPV